MCRVSLGALQVFCIAAVCGFALVAIFSIRPHTFSWANALAATGGDVAPARALALQKVCALHQLFTRFSPWKTVVEVCIQDVSSSHTQALSDCWTSTFANDWTCRNGPLLLLFACTYVSISDQLVQPTVFSSVQCRSVAFILQIFSPLRIPYCQELYQKTGACRCARRGICRRTRRGSRCGSFAEASCQPPPSRSCGGNFWRRARCCSLTISATASTLSTSTSTEKVLGLEKKFWHSMLFLPEARCVCRQQVNAALDPTP